MPVLQHNRSGEGPCVRSWIKGAIATFQLTPVGLSKLEEVGVSEGTKFPLHILIDLVRSGDAFTKGGAASAKVGRHEAEQFVFDFAENEVAETLLLFCEESEAFQDLHLVVHATPPVTQLLGPDARKLCKAVTLNIPVTVLSTNSLDLLLKGDKIPESTGPVAALRDWFARSYEHSWAEFASRRKDIQTPLPIHTEDELALD